MGNNTITQLRNDTASNWATDNPTLALGEVGLETDTNKMKFGDGSTAWNSLSYAGGGSSSFKYGMYTLSANQTSNIAVNNHIEWDTAEGSLGGLSTGAGQADGIITLPAGKTYKISAAVGFYHSAGGYTIIQAYNRTAGTGIGKYSVNLAQNANTAQATQPVITAIFTPSVDTDVEIRFITTNTTNTVYTDYSSLLIEEYGGY